MKDHKYKGLYTDRGAECCTALCQCGAKFDAKTGTARRSLHKQHVSEIQKKEDDRALLSLIFEWAERDQDECRHCGDEDGEKEANSNLDSIAALRVRLETAGVL